MNHKGCFVALLLAMTAAILPAAVSAFPEGAPWGAADPDAAENCESCHYDYDAIRESGAISIAGLPDKAAAGQTYELTIRFDDPDAIIAGFQVVATQGAFGATAENIEYFGAAIRSTQPAENDGGVTWTLNWTAPERPGERVVFYLAVSSANDDSSPFGDRIHFRSVELDL